MNDNNDKNEQMTMQTDAAKMTLTTKYNSGNDKKNTILLISISPSEKKYQLLDSVAPK